MNGLNNVIIAGGGLAGSEAAWQLAECGVAVTLYEMRPARSTPAHKTDRLAELVCSNSLKSNAPGAASWLLKEELRRGGSLLLRLADAHAVPGGAALAGDPFPNRVNYLASATFTQPAFLARRNTFTLNVFAERRSEYRAFERDGVGGSAALSFGLGRAARASRGALDGEALVEQAPGSKVRAQEHRALMAAEGESPLKGTKYQWQRNASRLDNRSRREFMVLSRLNLKTAAPGGLKRRRHSCGTTATEAPRRKRG